MSDEQILQARARAGQAIRDLGHAFIGRHATIDQIDRLSDVLEDITAELWPRELRARSDHEFGDQQEVVVLRDDVEIGRDPAVVVEHREDEDGSRELTGGGRLHPPPVDLPAALLAFLKPAIGSGGGSSSPGASGPEAAPTGTVQYTTC